MAMLEIVVEFFARLLFPFERKESTAKTIGTIMGKYTLSSVFPVKVQEIQEHAQ